MRILLASFYFVEYATELANALAKKHTVHLLLTKKRVSQTFGKKIYDKLENNVSFTLLPYNSVAHPSIFRSLYLTLKLCITFRPDVIHLQESLNPLNLLFFILKSKSLVLTVHDVSTHPGTPYPKKRISHYKIKFIEFARKLRKNKIIVHGEKLRKQFLGKYKRSPQDIFVVPHGSLFSYLLDNTAGYNEEPNTVLFFGRIQKYKGLKYLIEAEPIVSRAIPNFKIIIAGYGEDLSNYRNKILSNSHFELHERFIPNDEVASFFSRASAVVLPYIESSQSGIAAMALAFGKPIITTNVGSIPEMVENNITGIIIPAKNKEILGIAIIDLLRNHEKRRFFSQNAKKAALSEFSWDRVAMLTENVYKDAMKS